MSTCAAPGQERGWTTHTWSEWVHGIDSHLRLPGQCGRVGGVVVWGPCAVCLGCCGGAGAAKGTPLTTVLVSRRGHSSLLTLPESPALVWSLSLSLIVQLTCIHRPRLFIGTSCKREERKTKQKEKKHRFVIYKSFLFAFSIFAHFPLPAAFPTM